MPGPNHAAAPRAARAPCSATEPEHALDTAAARWVVINTGGTPSASEREAFAGWYAVDARHARRYDELLRLWEQLALVDAGALRTHRRGGRQRRRAVKPLVLGMALVIAVAALGGHRQVHALALAGETRAAGFAENIFNGR